MMFCSLIEHLCFKFKTASYVALCIVILASINAIKSLDQQEYKNKPMHFFVGKTKFKISLDNCNTFFWTQSVCGRFDPVCASDGMLYKNPCAFQEAFCLNSTLTALSIGSRSCNKG